ncbi:hypothetical protein TruAng_008006 [Truncatella angustata]|nr:hypothetical protein TruAng_008006 [Truncatella angustata]
MRKDFYSRYIIGKRDAWGALEHHGMNRCPPQLGRSVQLRETQGPDLRDAPPVTFQAGSTFPDAQPRACAVPNSYDSRIFTKIILLHCIVYPHTSIDAVGQMMLRLRVPLGLRNLCQVRIPAAGKFNFGRQIRATLTGTLVVSVIKSGSIGENSDFAIRGL